MSGEQGRFSRTHKGLRLVEMLTSDFVCLVILNRFVLAGVGKSFSLFGEKNEEMLLCCPRIPFDVFFSLVLYMVAS